MIPYAVFRFFRITILGYKIVIPIWGFFLVAAITTAALFSIKEAKRLKLPLRRLYLFLVIATTLSFYSSWMFSQKFYGPGLIAAFSNLPLFLVKGGLASSGIAIGFFLTTIIFWILKLEPSKYLDACAPGMCLLIVLIKLGCFNADCEVGTLTTLPWGLKYLGTEIIRHPNAIYHSFCGLLLFIYINKTKFKKRFNGQTMLMFFLLYSPIRFIHDFFVESYNRYYGFTESQIVVTIIFIVCFFWYRKLNPT